LEKNQIVMSYDAEADVVYISFGKPKKAVSEVIDPYVAVRRNPKTKEILGITNNQLYQMLRSKKAAKHKSPCIMRHNDPSFAGILTDNSGNPVQGVKAQIYGPDGKLLDTVYTDKDGWYMYNYKYTGKPATFKVELPDHGLEQSVTVKANSFAVVNFTI